MRTYTWLFLVSCFSLQGTAEVLFGQITSPGYPAPYPPNQTTRWTISVPQGRRIKLQFTHFDVGEGNEQCQDYVKVIDDGQPLVTACGRLRAATDDIPAPLEFISISNALTLTFASQPVQSRHYRGFHAVYTVLAHDECANRKTPCAHYCHSHPEGYFCSCAHGYVLGRDNASCEEKVIDCGLPQEIDNGYISYLSQSNSTTSGAAIQYHCVERYYELSPPGKGIYSCSDYGEWVNSQAGTELPTCSPVCGVSVELAGPGRIFGGVQSKDGMFPWQVFFRNPRGGGALISEEWVMTTASMVEGEENPTMYAGIRDLTNISPRHRLVAKKVFLHDKWKRGVPDPRTNFDNDIALIKLETKVELNNMVYPICLPGSDQEYILEEGKIGYISGWGATETRDKARILHMALISVVKMVNCQNQKADIGDFSQYVFSANMICAGGAGKDSCSGDSGGSFVVQDPHNDTLYFAAGIVSWGPRCGTFGLYTNVRNYLDWIKKTMMENKDI
ncbi:hypothetical protein NDU88_000859 [Pleurodeles waltl]|uniref:Complement subcomponent C1r n=2 Tax=Pleurodeles waltl TaxID=8319 RepID=A0AAV7P257_PLEWA|nr:hypothetical protein NDU88_000859 [Pleurodeles waltl]